MKSQGTRKTLKDFTYKKQSGTNKGNDTSTPLAPSEKKTEEFSTTNSFTLNDNEESISTTTLEQAAKEDEKKKPFGARTQGLLKIMIRSTRSQAKENFHKYLQVNGPHQLRQKHTSAPANIHALKNYNKQKKKFHACTDHWNTLSSAPRIFHISSRTQYKKKIHENKEINKASAAFTMIISSLQHCNSATSQMCITNVKITSSAPLATQRSNQILIVIST